MKNKSDVAIFETNILDGPIKFKDYLYTYVPDFDNMEYHEKVEAVQKMREEYKKNMIKLGQLYGFNGDKLVIPSSGLENKKDDYFEMTESLYKENKSLSKLKVFNDISIIRKDNPGVAIGYAVSDDPVLIIEDKENEIAILGHCGTSQISDKLPVHMLNILKKEPNFNIKNLRVYISSNLKKDHNKVIFKPKSIKNNPEVWKGCIKKKISKHNKTLIKKIILSTIDVVGYNLDREGAIVNMLIKQGIEKDNITINPQNTYTSVTLISDTKAKIMHEKDLESSYLVGAYYPETFKEYKPEDGRTRILR